MASSRSKKTQKSSWIKRCTEFALAVTLLLTLFVTMIHLVMGLVNPSLLEQIPTLNIMLSLVSALMTMLASRQSR